jgi:hypothetical protein
MPDEIEHLFQAQTNEEFSRSIDLDESPYLHWAAVGAFYSALHLVEGYLNRLSIHSSTHKKRNSNVATHLTAIYDDYRDLQEASEDARYKCIDLTKDDITECLDTLDAIKTYFRSTTPPLITA